MDNIIIKGLMLFLICCCTATVTASNVMPHPQAATKAFCGKTDKGLPSPIILCPVSLSGKTIVSLALNHPKSASAKQSIQSANIANKPEQTERVKKPGQTPSSNEIKPNNKEPSENIAPLPEFEENLAADVDGDIFAKEEKFTPAGSGNFFQQLWQNKQFAASYLFHYFPYNVSGNSDAQDYNHFWIFNFKSMGMMGDHVLFNFNGYANYTTQRGILRGVFTDPENNAESAKYFDMRELYLKDIGEKFDILIGKAFIENGLADPVTITNRFNTYNRIGFQNVIGMGAWQTRFDYFLNNNNEFSFIVLPFETKLSRLPDNSRWLGPLDVDIGQVIGRSFMAPQDHIPFNLLFPPLNLIPPLINEYRDANFNNWGYMFKYAATRKGYDYFVSLHYGPAIYSVIKFDPKRFAFINRYPDAFDATSGISIASGNLNVYGELLYQYTLQGRDINFIQQLIGLKYTNQDFAEKIGFEKITPLLELTHETITRKQTAPGYFFNSEILHAYAHDVLLGLIMNKTDKLSLLGGLDYDYTHDNFNYFAGTNYDRTENLSFQLLWAAYHGEQISLLNPDEGLYGLWRDNDNVSVRVNYHF